MRLIMMVSITWFYFSLNNSGGYIWIQKMCRLGCDFVGYCFFFLWLLAWLEFGFPEPVSVALDREIEFWGILVMVFALAISLVLF